MICMNRIFLNSICKGNQSPTIHKDLKIKVTVPLNPLSSVKPTLRQVQDKVYPMHLANRGLTIARARKTLTLIL
jgi:hypothetical protein